MHILMYRYKGIREYTYTYTYIPYMYTCTCINTHTYTSIHLCIYPYVEEPHGPLLLGTRILF